MCKASLHIRSIPGWQRWTTSIIPSFFLGKSSYTRIYISKDTRNEKISFSFLSICPLAHRHGTISWTNTSKTSRFHNNTLSQYLGGDYLTHRGKCHIFKTFPGWDLVVHFPPGRQRNSPGMIWKSSEVNW